MKTLCVITICSISCLISAASADTGDLIFYDTFLGTELNTDKWDEDVTGVPECSIDIEDHQLKSTFAGASTPQHAYAVSKMIPLPTNWSAVTISGQWYASQYQTGEHEIKVFDANEPSSFMRCAYVNWPSIHFHATDSDGLDQDTSRTMPTAYREFALTITRTGWTFVEDGTELVNTAYTDFANISNLRIQLGGWDYSANTGTMYFDTIVVTAEKPCNTTCPPDTMFCQLPDTPDQDWQGFDMVDYYTLPRYYEDYNDISDDVCVIRWWGLNRQYHAINEFEGYYTPCIRDPEICEEYRLCFAPPQAANPDLPDACSSIILVTPQKVDTGIEYYADGHYFPLYEYTVSIPCIEIPNPGFIAIQASECPDCLFSWLSAGDGIAKRWDEDSQGATGWYSDWKNRAICLSSPTDRPQNPCPCADAQFAPLNNLPLTLQHDPNEPTVYDFYFGPPEAQALWATDLTEPNYMISSLDPQTSYAWRMAARNASGTSYSSTFSFTTRGSYLGDLDLSDNIRLADYARFAAQWAAPDCHGCNNWCQGADLDYDGTMSLNDLALFAENWLAPWPPTNDTCENATPIGLETIYGTTLSATGTDITSCGSNDAKDVWFVFTAPVSTGYTFQLNMDDVAQAGTLAIFSDCGLTQMACATRTVTTIPPNQTIIIAPYVFLTLTEGQTVYIRLAAENNLTSSYSIGIE